MGREIAPLIQRAEEPVCVTRREEVDSVSFLHTLQLIWEATNLLDLRGLCYKVEATQKPMVFQSLCLKTSTEWLHMKNKDISVTGTW